jgi:hypothetical protein
MRSDMIRCGDHSCTLAQHIPCFIPSVLSPFRYELSDLGLCRICRDHLHRVSKLYRRGSHRGALLVKGAILMFVLVLRQPAWENRAAIWLCGVAVSHPCSSFSLYSRGSVHLHSPRWTTPNHLQSCGRTAEMGLLQGYPGRS